MTWLMHISALASTLRVDVLQDETSFCAGLMNNLVFNNRAVNKVVSKCFTKLVLINKIFINKSTRCTVQLSKAFIRPSLEYLSLIWNPYTKTSISCIEGVQKRMCNLIREVRHLTYKDQLKFLSIHSLRARRLRYQIIYIFKIYMYKGFSKLNFHDLFVVRQSRRTVYRGHSCHIIPKFSHNDYNYRLHFSLSLLFLTGIS